MTTGAPAINLPGALIFYPNRSHGWRASPVSVSGHSRSPSLLFWPQWPICQVARFP